MTAGRIRARGGGRGMMGQRHVKEEEEEEEEEAEEVEEDLNHPSNLKGQWLQGLPQQY